jgi:predicted HAD superfamily phosphohydrolase YqeG
MKKKVIFVDVDDTLIRSVGTKRIPMPGVVKNIKALYENGAALYLWSSGGGEYARTSAVELGIDSCFIAFLPKPDMYVDDQAVHEWLYCTHVLPGNAGEICKQLT